MNMPSNITPEEYAKWPVNRLYCEDKTAADFILKSIDDAKGAIAEQEKESKRIELIEEQLDLAIDLIERIQTIVNQSTKAKDIKAGIRAAIVDSMLEL